MKKIMESRAFGRVNSLCLHYNLRGLFTCIEVWLENKASVGRMKVQFHQHYACIVCVCVCVLFTVTLCVTYNFDGDARVRLSKNTLKKPLTKPSLEEHD